MNTSTNKQVISAIIISIGMIVSALIIRSTQLPGRYQFKYEPPNPIGGTTCYDTATGISYSDIVNFNRKGERTFLVEDHTKK